MDEQMLYSYKNSLLYKAAVLVGWVEHTIIHTKKCCKLSLPFV